MLNMGTNLSPFNIARVIVTFACLILFFLQSRRVIEKFFSNMTSTSTRYMSGKEADIRLPRIAICAKESFKSDKFPETMDEYLKLTYSQDELIAGLWGEEDYKVTEIATIYYGRCYVLEMPRSRTIVGLNITKDVLVYFIDQGQELCIINSVKTCDEQIQSIVVNNFYHDSKISANKLVREERYSSHRYFFVPLIWECNFSTCIKDPEYSHYDCYYNRMREKLRKGVKCLWPFQVHNNLNIGKDICVNMTEVDHRKLRP